MRAFPCLSTQTPFIMPDFLIVAVDWTILFFFIQQFSSPEVAITSVGGVSRTMRVVRVFLVLRLLRAMKFIRMLHIADNLTSELRCSDLGSGHAAGGCWPAGAVHRFSALVPDAMLRNLGLASSRI